VRIPYSTLQALAAVSASALAVRALWGPVVAGPLKINSPVNVQCIAGACLVGLALLASRVRLDPANPAPSPNAFWWMPAVAAAAAALALSPSLGFYLVSDDFCFLANAHLYWNEFPFQTGKVFFRPIQYLFGGLVHSIAGGDLWLWHAAGRAIHAAATAAFFFVAREVLSVSWAAMTAALVFAFHGSRPEAVAWVAGWTDVLSAGFLLAGLALYLREPHRKTPSGLAAAMFMFVCAAGAKETGFVFPLLLPLADWLKRVPWKQALRRWIPFNVAACALFVWRWTDLGGLGGYVNRATGRAEILSMSWLGPLKVLAFRLWGPLFFPWNWSREPGLVMGALFAAALFLYLILFQCRAERRVLIFALAITVLGSLPALPQLLIGADLEKSRSLYLPSAGFCLLLGALAAGKRQVICLAAIAAFHFAVLQRNLSIWGEVSMLARQVCQQGAAAVAEARGTITLQDLPQSINGVYFLKNCTPDCLKRESRRSLGWICQQPPETCPDGNVLILRWNEGQKRLEPVGAKLPSAQGLR